MKTSVKSGDVFTRSASYLHVRGLTFALAPFSSRDLEKMIHVLLYDVFGQLHCARWCLQIVTSTRRTHLLDQVLLVAVAGRGTVGPDR